MRNEQICFGRCVIVGLVALVLAWGASAMAQPPAEKKFEEDTIKTETGDLKITCIGHGTLMFTYQGKVIHIDPVSREADYTKMPDADIILITQIFYPYLKFRIN